MLPNDIYTIAGAAGGTAGFSGDGGAATSALLNNPGQVTWTGNLHIADTNNLDRHLDPHRGLVQK